MLYHLFVGLVLISDNRDRPPPPKVTQIASANRYSLIRNSYTYLWAHQSVWIQRSSR